MNAEQLEKWMASCQFWCHESSAFVVSKDDLRELFAGKVLVPVELLHAIEIDLSMECTNFDTLNKLRAIIEDKP
jgi:hypothetical protein